MAAKTTGCRCRHAIESHSVPVYTHRLNATLHYYYFTPVLTGWECGNVGLLQTAIPVYLYLYYLRLTAVFQVNLGQLFPLDTGLPSLTVLQQNVWD